MTRETKIGLLIGLGVILLIGIIVSDHLAVVDQPVNDPLLTFGDAAQNSIRPAESLARTEAMPERVISRAAPAQPIPTPQELIQRQQPQTPAPVSRPVDPLGLEDFPPAPSLRDLPRSRPAEIGSPGLVADADGGIGSSLRDRIRDMERFTPAPAVAIASDTPSGMTELAAPPMHRAEPQALPPAYHASALAPKVSPEPQPEPAQVRPAPTRSAPGTEAIQHTVQEGEHLTEIARHYYGDGNLWQPIARANPTQVDNRGRVRAGVRLAIPSVGELARHGVIHAVAEAPRATPANAPDVRTIRVAAGDSLSLLAARHLGSAQRWQELWQANRDQLDKPESLRSGMTLKLPASAAAVPASTPAPLVSRNTPVAPSSPREYVVRSGDTLFHIAQRELGDGERWAEIFEANRDRLESADRLIVGRPLRLPS